MPIMLWEENLPCPCHPEAQPAWAPSSRLAVCRVVSQGVGDLTEGWPVLGAEGPAALHQAVELGRAALRLWESSLSSLQVCREDGWSLGQNISTPVPPSGAHSSPSSHTRATRGQGHWPVSGTWALTPARGIREVSCNQR